MANPFEKRATEYLRDDEDGFLSLVSPEPLRTYLEGRAKNGQLYTKLVRIIGTPGSGKTTMATLLEAHMVGTVLAEHDKEGHRDIIAALEACGIVEKGRQAVAAVRLPMEGEYRDFWELPYTESLRTKLVLALIQARAVLGLVRNLERRPGTEVSFVTRSDARAALEEIGGSVTADIVARAREVERAVYQVGASLVPPPEHRIPDAAIRPFRPFDVIEAVRVVNRNGAEATLVPLVVLDDAHNLAPRQFDFVFRDLARREIRMARWIMMRLDGLTPKAALIEGDESHAPEIKAERDYVDVLLQRPEDRNKSRMAFRGVAKSMADRYLRRHPLFERRQWRGFATLLSTVPHALSEQTRRRVADEVDKTQRRLKIPSQRRALLDAEVERYVAGAKSQDTGVEVRLVMVQILMHRYVNQVPQQSLFEQEETPEPKHRLSADSGIAHGARLYLHHNYGRALHYGLTAISDASSENAELFLHLAAALVDRMEARIINGDPPALSSQQQDKILGDRARQIIDRWNFPFAASIRTMLTTIAEECRQESLSPNAWLDAGANAIGIPQEEFVEAVEGKHPELAQLLHYAVAYNAVLLRPNYSQGGKTWCLIELGGPAILAHSLTLSRGGFLEKRIPDLLRYAGMPS
jgi:hypothetical protein